MSQSFKIIPAKLRKVLEAEIEKTALSKAADGVPRVGVKTPLSNTTPYGMLTALGIKTPLTQDMTSSQITEFVRLFFESNSTKENIFFKTIGDLKEKYESLVASGDKEAADNLINGTIPSTDKNPKAASNFTATSLNRVYFTALSAVKAGGAVKFIMYPTTTLLNVCLAKSTDLSEEPDADNSKFKSLVIWLTERVSVANLIYNASYAHKGHDMSVEWESSIFFDVVTNFAKLWNTTESSDATVAVDKAEEEEEEEEAEQVEEKKTSKKKQDVEEKKKKDDSDGEKEQEKNIDDSSATPRENKTVENDTYVRTDTSMQGVSAAHMTVDDTVHAVASILNGSVSNPDDESSKKKAQSVSDTKSKKKEHSSSSSSSSSADSDKKKKTKKDKSSSDSSRSSSPRKEKMKPSKNSSKSSSSSSEKAKPVIKKKSAAAAASSSHVSESKAAVSSSSAAVSKNKKDKKAVSSSSSSSAPPAKPEPSKTKKEGKNGPVQKKASSDMEASSSSSSSSSSVKKPKSVPLPAKTEQSKTKKDDKKAPVQKKANSDMEDSSSSASVSSVKKPKTASASEGKEGKKKKPAATEEDSSSASESAAEKKTSSGAGTTDRGKFTRERHVVVTIEKAKHRLLTSNAYLAFTLASLARDHLSGYSFNTGNKSDIHPIAAIFLASLLCKNMKVKESPKENAEKVLVSYAIFSVEGIMSVVNAHFVANPSVTRTVLTARGYFATLGLEDGFDVAMKLHKKIAGIGCTGFCGMFSNTDFFHRALSVALNSQFSLFSNLYCELDDGKTVVIARDMYKVPLEEERVMAWANVAALPTSGRTIRYRPTTIKLSQLSTVVNMIVDQVKSTILKTHNDSSDDSSSSSEESTPPPPQKKKAVDSSSSKKESSSKSDHHKKESSSKSEPAKKESSSKSEPAKKESSSKSEPAKKEASSSKPKSSSDKKQPEPESTKRKMDHDDSQPKKKAVNKGIK